MARQPPQLVEQQRALGRHLAALREAAGLYQADIAWVVPCHRTTVTHAEAGSQLPGSPFWEAVDRAVGANGALLAAYDAFIRAREAHRAEQQAQRRARAQPSHQADAGRVRSGHVMTPTLAGSDVADDPRREPMLALPWSPRGTVEAAVALRGGGGLMERRGFLFLTGATLTAPAHQWLVHEPGPLASGLSGGRVSAGLVDRLPAMIVELRRMDDVAGGGSVLALAQHGFGWVAGLLDRASYDERTGRKLHVALAELGQLAGWAAYDAGQLGLSQRYYIAALRAAHSADDRPLGAHILGCMAEQAARQGRPADAVTLIETAVAGVRGQQTPRLLAQLYNWQAYAFATLQDPSACTAAISRARTQTEQFQPDNDPAWLYWVNPADITAFSGQCLLQLGQPDRAAVMLDEGIALFDESLVRDRQLHLTYLTDALARPGTQRDLDTAVGYGMTAIELAEGLDSTLAAARIRDLYYQLQPDAQVPAVRDFLERAREFAKV
ncbi:MAG: helix-turn-helix domain-containing protein [Pseudonocardiaceae bacterium]